MIRYVSLEEAIQSIPSQGSVFVHGQAATPSALLRALEASASRFQNLELLHLHTLDPAHYTKEEFSKNFRVTNLFIGKNIRHSLDYERIDYLPCFLSELPQLFRSGRRKIDVALIHVSPPDAHGFCSLGVSVDIARAAVEAAKLVIAQVNPKMPRVHGDGIIPSDLVDYFVKAESDIPVISRPPLSEAEKQIGNFISTLIEDGSTIQVGVGAVPDAALSALKNHRHLGIHSETWSDGVLDLLISGAIDNSKKIVYPGRSVSSFITGSKAVYDFIDDNPSVVQLDAGYVNSPQVIARNPKVVAINSAVEVDLTGQVCADSVGCSIISGVGGQMDFIRGASLSPGGKPIIAFTSRTSSGRSRLVPTLTIGAGVVTTRAHIHYIITEYGIADLYGKTLKERANLLISIAHPDDRETLSKAWFKLYHS